MGLRFCVGVRGHKKITAISWDFIFTQKNWLHNFQNWWFWIWFFKSKWDFSTDLNFILEIKLYFFFKKHSFLEFKQLQLLFLWVKLQKMLKRFHNQLENDVRLPSANWIVIGFRNCHNLLQGNYDRHPSQIQLKQQRMNRIWRNLSFQRLTPWIWIHLRAQRFWLSLPICDFLFECFLFSMWWDEQPVKKRKVINHYARFKKKGFYLDMLF